MKQLFPPFFRLSCSSCCELINLLLFIHLLTGQYVTHSRNMIKYLTCDCLPLAWQSSVWGMHHIFSVSSTAISDHCCLRMTSLGSFKMSTETIAYLPLIPRLEKTKTMCQDAFWRNFVSFGCHLVFKKNSNQPVRLEVMEDTFPAPSVHPVTALHATHAKKM